MKIYLIGMPGCGKSSVGKKLSQQIKYNYIDLDSYIENKASLSIPKIFELYGEKRFRELEKEALNDIYNMDNTIISCGGGIIGNLENKNLMNGNIVFIDLDLNIIEERIKNDKINIRPMFKTKTVKELYNERIDKYLFFKDIIVENIDLDSCVKQIIKELGI